LAIDVLCFVPCILERLERGKLRPSLYLYMHLLLAFVLVSGLICCVSFRSCALVIVLSTSLGGIVITWARTGDYGIDQCISFSRDMCICKLYFSLLVNDIGGATDESNLAKQQQH
jgi:hypothetical protein